jgi:hypothetical protein
VHATQIGCVPEHYSSQKRDSTRIHDKMLFLWHSTFDFLLRQVLQAAETKVLFGCTPKMCRDPDSETRAGTPESDSAGSRARRGRLSAAGEVSENMTIVSEYRDKVDAS